MNDQMELQFGADIYCRHLLEASTASDTDHNLRDAFAQVAHGFKSHDVFGWGFSCFATSLSAQRDLLSQWRGYGGGVGGFAIGFSYESLAGHTYAFHPQSTALGTTPFRTELHKVGYGIDVAETRAAQFVSAAITRWNSKDKPGFVLKGAGPDPYLLAVEVFREISTVKHAAFEEEQEWRLWAISDYKYPVNIRAGRGGLLPYLEIGVNLRFEPGANVQTIGELVVGPHPDKSGQIAAARELMKVHGHNPDLVNASDAPFRG
jgi:hypothetical protein